MSLIARSQMTQDNGLKTRIAAAAGMFGIRDATIWVENHIWLLVANEEWSFRYEKAGENDPEVDPANWYGIHGKDPSVISDDMIVAKVQEVLESEAAKIAAEAERLELERKQREEERLAAELAALPTTQEEV